MSDYPILTKKMYRTILDAKSQPGAVIYFPCDEQSGNTLTDSISGVVITDDAAATATGDGVTIKATGAVTSGTFPALASGKSIISILANDIGAGGGALSAFSIGAITGDPGFGNYGSFTVSDGTGAGVGAAFQALSSGDRAVRIGTFDGSTGLVSAYSSVDGAPTALDATADGSSELGGFTPTATAVIGGALDDDVFYGCAAYYLDSLPSQATILAIGDWVARNWLYGIKGLPPQLEGIS